MISAVARRPLPPALDGIPLIRRARAGRALAPPPAPALELGHSQEPLSRRRVGRVSEAAGGVPRGQVHQRRRPLPTAAAERLAGRGLRRGNQSEGHWVAASFAASLHLWFRGGQGRQDFGGDFFGVDLSLCLPREYGKFHGCSSCAIWEGWWCCIRHFDA